MNKRNIVLGVVVLLGLWVIVFVAASLIVNNMEGQTEIVTLPTVTQRPVRTDVPLLEATDDPATPESTPTRAPTQRPTPAFTLSALEIQRFEPQEADLEALINPQATIPVKRDVDGGAYPIRIAIEDLDLVSAVVAVQTDPNFDIVTPREEVGYYALSPKIGAGGNSVFVGHVYPGRVFNSLLEAEEGMIVRVTDELYEDHYYEVTEIIRFPYEIGKDEDRETGFRYMYDDSEERITLVTCYPEYEWTHRFVVRAVPIDPPDGTANRSRDTGR